MRRWFKTMLIVKNDNGNDYRKDDENVFQNRHWQCFVVNHMPLGDDYPRPCLNEMKSCEMILREKKEMYAAFGKHNLSLSLSLPQPSSNHPSC